MAIRLGPQPPTLRAYILRRRTLIAFAIICVVFFTSWRNRALGSYDDRKLRPEVSAQKPSRPEWRLGWHRSNEDQPPLPVLHLLLVSASEARLCQTLLTASVLGYPTPTLIAYNQSFGDDQYVGDGRYLGKISGVLDWLEQRSERQGDDLVLVVDTYGAFNYFNDASNISSHLSGDVWFQLRPETLIKRYGLVNAKVKETLFQQRGLAAMESHISQTIVFGAGKRCAPNASHSVACVSVPESPLPRDMYGANTDTSVGESEFSSRRPRYLNSGFVMGPVSDMRALFRRAQKKAAALQKSPDARDSGLHHGSDQAIFQEIWGEQELQRQMMRQRREKTRASAPGQRLIGAAKANGERESGNNDDDDDDDDFGIGIDYWSDLSHQTADATSDGRFVRYGHPVAQQAAQRLPHDCTPRATDALPADIVRTTLPDASQFSPLHGWDQVALYTNVCLDTIPVAVQANADDARGAWPQMWMHPAGRRLMEEVQARGDRGGGARVGARWLSWPELCPAGLEDDLYGDA